MGDMCVPVQRYGKGWDPVLDSLHMVRTDPLTDPRIDRSDKEEHTLSDLMYESEGEMELDETLELAQHGDMLRLFSRTASAGGAAEAIDPAFFASSDDEGDRGGGAEARGGGGDTLPLWLQRRQAQRKARRRASNGGSVFGGPPAHFTVLSPFEPPKSANNLAAASYEGPRVGDYFARTLRQLTQVRLAAHACRPCIHLELQSLMENDTPGPLCCQVHGV